MSRSSKPPRWPPELEYLRTSKFHSSVPPAIRLELQGQPSANGQATQQSSPVQIRSIACTSHPAFGQFGLFASKKILPGTHILDYIGEIHCDDRPDSDYDLSLYRSSEGVNVGIDARVMGNEARFINDYRGVSKRPNAVFCDAKMRSGEMRMSIWSAGEIKKGEEILVSYGKTWWRARTQVPD